MGTTALAVHEHDSALALRPELDVEYATRQLLARVAIVAQVKEKLMKPEVHFGKPPGINKNAKPVLLKPGAETLLMAFNISPDYKHEDLSEGDEVVRYRFCVSGYDVSGRRVGQGLGEASSNEEKYRWRKAAKAEYDGTDPTRRRIKHRAGWQGKPDTQEFQVRTYPPDIANTILKMASKRALVHLAITVTACSDMFDQDLDDLDEGLRSMGYEDEDEQPRAATGTLKQQESSGKTTTLEGTILPAGEEGQKAVWQAARRAMPSDKSEDEWRARVVELMEQRYGGVKSAKLLTKDQAREFTAFIDSLKIDLEAMDNTDADPVDWDKDKPHDFGVATG